jgi:arylsulfatase A-like enzyme
VLTCTRRQFLSAATPLLGAQPNRRRPNVLVFMSDQESALLPGPVALPNRGKLSSRGITFSNAFCNTPQCSPARSALLTGNEPHRTGVLTNVDSSSLGKPLPESMPTAGTVFRAAGYSTGYFGKWHLGPTFGFDHFEEGRDEEVSRRAAEWIRRQRGPWLAWVSILNPHDIYQLPRVLKEVRPRTGIRPPASGLENLKGKPAEQQGYVDHDQGKATRDYTPQDWIRYRSFYCDLVEKADACLGAVLSGVTDLDSTIIAYTSDHGDALGEHGLPFKGPFMYDELLRIPLLISAPGEFSRAGSRDDLVTQADFSPTLAALAGLDWPGQVSGLDLTRKRDVRDAAFLEYYAKQKWVNPIRTIRTRRWKLNLYDSGHRELYDLAGDPREIRNLAGSAIPVEAQLARRLNAWRTPRDATRSSTNPH